MERHPQTSASFWSRGAIRATTRRVPFERVARLIDLRPGRDGDGELAGLRHPQPSRSFGGRSRHAMPLTPVR